MPRMIKRLPILIRDAWIIAGLILVLLLVVEVVSGILVYPKGRLAPQGGDHRLRVDIYLDAPWIEEYLKEFRSTTVHWEPYVHYRANPFGGKHLIIDERGHRRTVYPEAVSSRDSKPLRIFMFGASTMWGSGARNEYTIASIVGKTLSEMGIAAQVTNFAESGYVSTQEVITLLLELRNGNIPDLVVFYDGIGDTFAAFQSGMAGRPMNEYRRVREFNLLHESRRGDLTKMYLTSHLERSKTVQVLQAVMRRMRPAPESPGEQEVPAREEFESAAVEEKVVEVWIATVQIAEHLGRAYGFTPIFYWQPVIFTKDELSEYERKEVERRGSMAGFFEKTYAHVKRREADPSGHNFYDISGIFDGVKETCYVDFAHVSEAANEVIARRMARDIREIARR